MKIYLEIIPYNKLQLVYEKFHHMTTTSLTSLHELFQTQQIALFFNFGENFKELAQLFVAGLA